MLAIHICREYGEVVRHLGRVRSRGCGHVGNICGDKEACDVIYRHSFIGQMADVISHEGSHRAISTGCRWDGCTALTGNDTCRVREGKAEVLANRAGYQCRSVSLGRMVVVLRNTEEAGRWAVAASTFVFIAPQAVEVVQCVLVGIAALAADD